jgi:hypothetical protein
LFRHRAADIVGFEYGGIKFHKFSLLRYGGDCPWRR